MRSRVTVNDWGYMRGTVIAEKVSIRLVIACLVAAPWIFGTSELWTGFLLGLMLQTAAILLLVSRMIDISRRMMHERLLVSLFLVLIAYILIQVIPFPVRVVEAMSPLSATLRQRLGALSEQSGLKLAMATISLAPGTSWRAIMSLASVASAFYVITSVRPGWPELRRVGELLVASGALMAAAGILQFLAGADKLLGFHEPIYGGHIFGPFTNRNHFAAYMNLVSGVGLGLLYSEGAERIFDPSMGSLRGGWRRLRGLRSVSVLVVMALLMTVTATILTLSRGGILAMLLVLGSSGLLTVWGRGRHGYLQSRGRAGIWLLLICSFTISLWIGWDRIIARLVQIGEYARDPLASVRLAAWRDTLHLWAACPWWGCGFGAFQHAFPLFESDLLHFGRWTHAHNDFAEFLSEGGIAGCLLMLGWVAAFSFRVWRGYVKSSRRRRFFAVGMLSGIAAVILHSLVDYNLHRFAIALSIVSLAGLALVMLSEGGGYYSGVEQGIPTVWSLVGRRVTALALIAGLLFLMHLEIDGLRGQAAFARLRQWARAVETTEEEKDLGVLSALALRELAIVREHCRRCPDVLVDAGVLTLGIVRRFDVPPEERVQLAMSVRRAVETAVCEAPGNSEYWEWLIRWDDILGLREESRRLSEMTY